MANLRIMGDVHRPAESSIEPQLTALAELQRGLICHLGLSNATLKQVRESGGIAEVVCVHNHYNRVHCADEALIDELAAMGIAYALFFPLDGFSPLQSDPLSTEACRLGATPMQVLAWLFARAQRVADTRHVLACALAREHRGGGAGAA